MCIRDRDIKPRTEHESLYDYEKRRNKNTIEFHLCGFNQTQSFREPLKPRGMTTAIGNWINMKYGGIRKERQWDEKNQTPGLHHLIFDLKYLRKKFSLDTERQQCMENTVRDNKKGTIDFFTKCNVEGDGCTCPSVIVKRVTKKTEMKIDKPDKTIETTTAKHETEVECTLCDLTDDELLNFYIENVTSCFKESAFEKWLEDPDVYPPTYKDDDKELYATDIQRFARGMIVRSKKETFKQAKEEREENKRLFFESSLAQLRAEERAKEEYQLHLSLIHI